MPAAESHLMTLRMPALPDPFVPRERITQAIATTLRCCLICAPRGYGATTAVSAALAEEPGDVIWVDVEAGADQVQLLDRILEAALRLSDRSPETGTQWLVVDGVPRKHTRVWAELAAMARRLPAHRRLVVMTPHRAPVDWLVMAAENGSLHLDRDALAFTSDEAARLLHAWCQDMDVETLSAVVEESEGWAAALAAAGACARLGRMDRNWLGNAGAAQLFADWLADQPQRTRDMLIATSVAETLSTGLAQAITGDPAAVEDLLELDEHLGYLADGLGPAELQGRWWRRHGLLTAALQQRARPDRRERHSRAADWFASQGDVATTMYHLVQAGRAQEAGDFLLEHARPLFISGKADDVLAMYRTLPGDWGNRVQNLLVIGWGQVLSGDHHGAGFALAALEAEVRSGPSGCGPALPEGDPNLSTAELVGAQVDLLRAVLASYRADARTMVESGKAAADVLRHHPPSDGGQLAWVTLLRGLIWSARFEAARSLCRRLQDEPFPNEVMREASLIPLFAIQAAIDGDVRRASSLVARTRTWLKLSGIDAMAAPDYAALSAEATLACETGDTQRAIDLATAVISRAAEQQMQGEQVAALTMRARGRWALGDFAGAQSDLTRARDLALSACPGSALLGAVGLAQVTLHMATGDLVRAERVLDSLPRGEDWDLTKAATLLAGQPATAVRMLEGLNPQTPRARCLRHMLLATALAGSSRLIAQRHLRHAAAIAYEHGMAMLLVEAAPAVVQLAGETAVEAQDDAMLWAVAQRERFLAQFDSDSRYRLGAAPQPLSRGELQLIALLPTRSGNAEIAAMLGISVNTVKTRLRRLYAKLGARSRDDAVAKAQQRGLIPVPNSFA